MIQKILLVTAAVVLATGAFAQKKQKPVTAYAITAAEKGQSKWSEVRLVDMNTGEVLNTIYQSHDDIPVLNARTGKPVVKKDNIPVDNMRVSNLSYDKIRIEEEGTRKVVVIEIRDNHPNGNNNQEKPLNVKHVRIIKRVDDGPFATNSAACAYDKKHNRLYYTPMGINQLRYIDLKSKTPSIKYFEDESFGVVTGTRDYGNQITRMVIAADGNGYALTNNSKHLIRFTTNKKAVITDLGALTNDPSNGKNNVLGGYAHGGDIVADDNGDLYLITANRAVYHINLKTLSAKYKGTIQGLPAGFSTNGAVVESGTNVIVTSSTNVMGYYKFDLNTMEAKKISAADKVYNASDLANANLVSSKKIKEQTEVSDPEAEIPFVKVSEEPISAPSEIISQSKLAVFPNPVTSGVVTLSFNDFEPGRYEVNLIDVSGKLIQSQSLMINNKYQTRELRIPAQISKGNYLVQITSAGKIVKTEKLLIQ